METQTENKPLHNETFKVKLPLQYENSFGVIRAEDDVEIEVTVCINNPEYGWFEISDTKTGGVDWYAEGGLWIDGNTITEYDGVFALISPITDKLKEWGYDTSDVEEF